MGWRRTNVIKSGQYITLKDPGRFSYYYCKIVEVNWIPHIRFLCGWNATQVVVIGETGDTHRDLLNFITSLKFDYKKEVDGRENQRRNSIRKLNVLIGSLLDPPLSLHLSADNYWAVGKQSSLHSIQSGPFTYLYYCDSQGSRPTLSQPSILGSLFLENYF